MSAQKPMTQLSTNEMRGILAEQINGLRDGSATAATVNAISNAVGKILSSIKLELEYHKLVGKKPHIRAMLMSAEDGDGLDVEASVEASRIQR